MAATSGTSLTEMSQGRGCEAETVVQRSSACLACTRPWVPLQNEQEHTDLATRIFEDVRMPQPACSLGVLVPRAVTQHLSFMDSVFLRLKALC